MPDSTEQIEQTPEAQKESSNAESNEAKTNSQMVPISRLNDHIQRTKAAEAELEQFRSAEEKRLADSEAAKKKQLEDQQKFQELYQTAESEKVQAVEQVTALTAQVESMAKSLEAQWDVQKELIPELYRNLVGAMPIEDRIQWLSENSEKLTKEKGNGTPRAGASKRITPPTQRQDNGRPAVPTFKF